MDTPETLSAEFVRSLARDLHRRQILGYLRRSGMELASTASAGAYVATDAEGRRALVEFAPDGAVATTTEDTRKLIRRFDENGAFEELVDPAGLKVTMTQGTHGRRHIAREGHGEFVIGRDPYGLPYSVAYPDGGEVRFDFEAEGGETVTDQLGGMSKVHRADDGRVLGVTDRNGHTTRIDEQPDGDGSLLRIETPGGQRHEFGLDELGNLARWALNGREVASYYGRMANGLPQQARYHDGHWVSYECEGDRITVAQNPASTVRLIYDAAGHIVSEDQNGLVVSYERDLTGLLTAIVLPDGEKVRFRYDAAGKLEAVQDWAGGTTQVAWAQSGQISALRHPNGVTSILNSNPLGLITSIVTEGPRSSEPLVDMAFAHDAMDRVVEMREHAAVRRFRYDAAGRLTDVAASDRAFGESWQLDPMGNRIRDNGAPCTIDPDNRLTAAGAEPIDYDAFGRTRSVMTPRGRATLSYNGQGQLVRLQHASGSVADYAYDALGRRISTSVDGVVTRYLWAGQTMICEWREGASGWRRRDHLFLPGVFLPLAMRVDGEIFRQHCDHRCAPQAMTDSRGTTVWRARLKAYGAAQIAQQVVENPWRLANQYCDAESGLHYNLARYHHPDLGRYLTPDPLFDDANRGNLYIYAANDPLNRCDPTGEIIPLIIAGVVIGAVIGAAVKAYQTRNEPMTWERAGKIAGAAVVGGIVGGIGAAIGAAAAGAATAAGVTSLITLGAIEGAVSGAAEPCAEAALTGEEYRASDSAWGAVIGGVVGALTAGMGALWAARIARKMRRAAEAERKVAQELAEAQEKAAREALEAEQKAAREAAEAQEKAAREAAEAETKAAKEAEEAKKAAPKPGKRTGKKTKINKKDDEATRRSLQRENDSADVLEKQGYDIEQNPPARPNGKKPDYKINGEYADSYAPAKGTKPGNVMSTVEAKVNSGQAETVILNLDDWEGDIDALRKELSDDPIAGLKEILIVKDGTVFKL